MDVDAQTLTMGEDVAKVTVPAVARDALLGGRWDPPDKCLIKRKYLSVQSSCHTWRGEVKMTVAKLKLVPPPKKEAVKDDPKRPEGFGCHRCYYRTRRVIVPNVS